MQRRNVVFDKEKKEIPISESMIRTRTNPDLTNHKMTGLQKRKLQMYPIPLSQDQPRIRFNIKPLGGGTSADREFEKILPRSQYHRKSIASLEFSNLKTEIEEMCKTAQNLSTGQVKLEIPMKFLLMHSAKILFLLREFEDVYNLSALREEIRTIANNYSDVKIEQIFEIWGKIQEIFIDYSMMRDNHIAALLEEFESFEESNLILKDFIALKSKTNINGDVDIQVVQVLQETEKKVESLVSVEITTPPILPEVHMKITKEFNDTFVQTDPVEFAEERVEVDLMDKMTGPDREIPVYRAVSVMVDLRHPVEDKYDEVKKLLDETINQNLIDKRGFDERIENLQREHQQKMFVHNTKFEAEIALLKKQIADLISELEPLREEYASCVIERDIKTVELSALRESFAKLQLEHDSLVTADNKLKIEHKILEEKFGSVKIIERKLESEIIEYQSKIHNFTNLTREYEIEQGKLNDQIKRLKENLIEYMQEKKNHIEQYSEVKFSLTEKTKENEILIKKLEESKLAEELLARKQAELQENKIALEKKIDLLIGFADSEMEIVMNELGTDGNKIPSPDQISKIYKMIEANNMRISIVEQKNGRLREILLHQAISTGYSAYRNYQPLENNRLLYNPDNIIKTRPSTADSSKTQFIIPETYIIGAKSTSRPVSAASVRILRPVDSRSLAKEDPILVSSLKNGKIQIEKSQHYPPRKFPFWNCTDPLDDFDKVAMKEVKQLEAKSELSSELSKPKKLFRWKERPSTAI